MNFKTLLLINLMIICLQSLHSQVRNEDLIQFSGIVVTADSINPVPFTNIQIKGTWRGTVSDYYGYFSFVAQKEDTIVFSAIGFKKGQYVIPDTMRSDRYSVIEVMAADTIMLTQTVIYPWPSKEQFKEAFLKFDVPDDDYERARKNLDLAQLSKMIENYPMDASMNYKFSMQQVQDKLYYNGQTQPITILNPFAWAEFIKAWKEGKFKRKKE